MTQGINVGRYHISCVTPAWSYIRFVINPYGDEAQRKIRILYLQSECNCEQNLNEVLKIAICMTNFPLPLTHVFMHFFSAGWRRIRSRVQLRYRRAEEHLQDAGPPRSLPSLTSSRDMVSFHCHP